MRAGIEEIIVVTGYMAESFSYLQEKFGVKLIYNPEYLTRNNNGSIYAVKEYLGNSYICSAANYFEENPFENEVDESYYSAVYAEGDTKEWCIREDENGYINEVRIGGYDAWYMLGHVFWSREFSRNFIGILELIYNEEETREYLWESIFMKNLSVLKMKIRKYSQNTIFEFDTLDELREFDESYLEDSRSDIMKCISRQLNIAEREIINITAYKGKDTTAAGFYFEVQGEKYKYAYNDKEIRRGVE